MLSGKFLEKRIFRNSKIKIPELFTINVLLKVCKIIGIFICNTKHLCYLLFKAYRKGLKFHCVTIDIMEYDVCTCVHTHACLWLL